jgi:hypothetical protein
MLLPYSNKTFRDPAKGTQGNCAQKKKSEEFPAVFHAVEYLFGKQ